MIVSFRICAALERGHLLVLRLFAGFSITQSVKNELDDVQRTDEPRGTEHLAGSLVVISLSGCNHETVLETLVPLNPNSRLLRVQNSV